MLFLVRSQSIIYQDQDQQPINHLSRSRSRSTANQSFIKIKIKINSQSIIYQDQHQDQQQHSVTVTVSVTVSPWRSVSAKQVNSYPSQLEPKILHPSHLVPESTRTQVNSYPSQVVLYNAHCMPKLRISVRRDYAMK